MESTTSTFAEEYFRDRYRNDLLSLRDMIKAEKALQAALRQKRSQFAHNENLVADIDEALERSDDNIAHFQLEITEKLRGQ